MSPRTRRESQRSYRALFGKERCAVTLFLISGDKESILVTGLNIGVDVVVVVVCIVVILTVPGMISGELNRTLFFGLFR